MRWRPDMRAYYCWIDTLNQKRICHNLNTNLQDFVSSSSIQKAQFWLFFSWLMTYGLDLACHTRSFSRDQFFFSSMQSYSIIVIAFIFTHMCESKHGTLWGFMHRYYIFCLQIHVKCFIIITWNLCIRYYHVLHFFNTSFATPNYADMEGKVDASFYNMFLCI